MKSLIRISVLSILLLIGCDKPKKKKAKQVSMTSVVNLISSLLGSLEETKEEIKIERPSIRETSFLKIEEAPIFPSCENEKSEKSRKNCLQQKISRFVGNNFNADLAQELGLDSGRKRIMVQFKIDQDGYIKDIKASAPHPRLKKEAIRIIKKLPKMIPGKARGIPVSVKYALPINFVVE